MKNEIRRMIDAAYGCIGDSMCFCLTMHVLGEGVKRFYFHHARVVKWEVSVWENPLETYPKRMVLVSASGLRLEYTQGCGLHVYNPKRVIPSRNTRREQYYCQSISNQNINFVKV